MMFCKDCPLPHTEGYSICDVCAHSKIQEYRKPSEGVIHHFLSIKDFCEEHNLSRPDISKLLRGKINQYKGWTNGLS